jgi:pilus assembly protein CpaB
MNKLTIGRPGSIFVLGAVVLGGLTAYALYNYLQGVSGKATPPPQTIDVIVPLNDIAPREEIKANMIGALKVPAGLVIPNTTAIKPDQVIGKVAVNRLKAREQIRLKDIVEKGKLPGLSYNLPPGMRAITIAVSDTKGVSGAIFPGDHVDILCSLKDPSRGEQVVQVPLQNLLVLAIDKAKTETDTGANQSITLCVKPEEAQMLTVAEQGGDLRVILRPRDDQAILDDKAMSIDHFLKKAPKTAEEPKPVEKPVVEQAPLPPPPPPAPPPRRIKIYDGANAKEFDVKY